MKTNTYSTDFPENRRGRNTSFHEAIVTLIAQPKRVQKKKTTGQCHEYRHKNPDKIIADLSNSTCQIEFSNF